MGKYRATGKGSPELAALLTSTVYGQIPAGQAAGSGIFQRQRRSHTHLLMLTSMLKQAACGLFFLTFRIS